jgi:hypothetical protein
MRMENSGWLRQERVSTGKSKVYVCCYSLIVVVLDGERLKGVATDMTGFEFSSCRRHRAPPHTKCCLSAITPDRQHGQSTLHLNEGGPAHGPTNGPGLLGTA